MKKLIFYITILDLEYLIYSIVPLWNFEKTAIKLTLPYSDTFTLDLYNKQLILNKNIIQSENSISQNNIITIINAADQLIITNKDWDYIDSFYEYNNNYYICPKGTYSMSKCNKTNEKVECEEISRDIGNNTEWELKCYIHYQFSLITVFYLNTEIKIKSYNFIDFNWKGNIDIHEGILDFKWMTEEINKNYMMFAIGINGQEIELFLVDFNYVEKGNYFNTGNILTNKVYKNLTYKHACFNNDSLYFITYDNEEFISGFRKFDENVTADNFAQINLTINENSPLNFYDEIAINKINFIEKSQYVYYNISSKNETFYGIIDIESNKVIYNTNKEISEFKPFSNSSMLAISGSSAYLICTFKDNNNDKCIYKCDNNINSLIDATNPNSCGNDCTKYILKPENICIESCDENIYILKNKECSLCFDIDKKYPYKVINAHECIEKKPENSYFVNEKLYLIACNEGYFYENGTCTKNFTCHEKCKECKGEPIEGNQNCLSCKDENDVLQEGNCINKCDTGYYEGENKECFKCDVNCSTCDKISSNCTSCKDGEYLNNGACKYCFENCQTCKEGGNNENQNCLSCKKDFPYLINAEGYNQNCVENCSVLNLTIEGNTCVNKSSNSSDGSSDDSGKSNNENQNEDKTNYMIWIFVILMTIILIIILLIIFKRCFRKNDQDLMDNINTELKDKIVD